VSSVCLEAVAAWPCAPAFTSRRRRRAG
jgi:hypothetical protein